jgi:succinate dehydrogenase/fumarate reductase cytochrome b subunit
MYVLLILTACVNDFLQSYENQGHFFVSIFYLIFVVDFVVDAFNTFFTFSFAYVYELCSEYTRTT